MRFGLNNRQRSARVGTALGLCLLALAARPAGVCASDTVNYFEVGLSLYKSGQRSEAVDAFDKAIKHKQHAKEAQQYVDQIRKETVQAIRDKYLSGISKTHWQSKFYFITTQGDHVTAGISAEELFEPTSLNFREGGVEALLQLAQTLERNETANIDVQLINERTQDVPADSELLRQRLAEVFSYLALAAQDQLPKYTLPSATAP